MIEAPELRELTIVLEEYVPHSDLGINGRARIHWAVLDKRKKEAKKRVAEQLMSDGWPGEGWNLQRSQVIVTFVFPNRRKRDIDNLAGRVKPLLDALVDAKILADDNAETIDLVIRCRAQAGTTETVIDICEINPDDDWTQGPLL